MLVLMAALTFAFGIFLALWFYMDSSKGTKSYEELVREARQAIEKKAEEE